MYAVRDANDKMANNPPHYPWRNKDVSSGRERSRNLDYAILCVSLESARVIRAAEKLDDRYFMSAGSYITPKMGGII